MTDRPVQSDVADIARITKDDFSILDTCTTDSAIGSELVEDDVSVPLSVASLSDDDDDDDIDGDEVAQQLTLSDSQSLPPCPSPTKSLPRSPSKAHIDGDVPAPVDEDVSGSCPDKPTPSSNANSVATPKKLDANTFTSDANDNDVDLSQRQDSTSSISPAKPCGACATQNTAVSDSRDGEFVELKSLSVRRRVGISERQQQQQRQPAQSLVQEQGLFRSLETGSHTSSNSVEDIIHLGAAGVDGATTGTNHLADSCDEDDELPVVNSRGSDRTSRGDSKTEVDKKVSAIEDDDSANVSTTSFNKWDPTSWPSWFERLFTSGGANGSCESSFDDDVVLDQNGTCALDPETHAAARTPSLSKNEFNCSCCFELMVEPTTIQCGHSFCRACLANWYFGSNAKRTCPQCRQSWNGNPQTNVILRSAIRTLFPTELAAREAEAQLDIDSLKKLKRFEVAVSVTHSGIFGSFLRYLWPRTGNGFANGCIFSFSLFLIVYLAFTWRHSEEEMTTVTKPIVDWRVEDVASWLDALGPWTKDYRASFVENAIDGQLVLALTDRDLQEPPFSIKLHYHRRAFLAALTATRNHGAKPPTNLWEYKAAKPGTALLLLWGLKSLPRHTILLYMLVFDYDAIFLPFVHITCPLVADSGDNIPLDSDQRRLDPAFWELQPFRRKALFFQSLVSSKEGTEVSTSSVALQSPTFAQWVEFLMKTLLLPHFLVAEVAWDWLNVHYWTVRFILMDCLFLSVVELLRLRLLCQRNFLQFFTPYSAVMQEIGLIVCVCFIWRFLPNVLCDAVFYSLLYVFPFLRMINFAFRAATFLLRS